jgi:hypothetical protein
MANVRRECSVHDGRTFVSNAYVLWGRTAFTSGHSKRNELEAKNETCNARINVTSRRKRANIVALKKQ